MANIKYAINGKADTKPIDKTGNALTKLADKVNSINSKIQGLAVVTAFNIIAGAIDNPLRKFDEFKK